MKQGSSRYGNDFETKAREFIAKYGFDIVAENESIKCAEKAHMKPSHEIDFIAWFSSIDDELKIPKPPCNGFNGKFMVSCKDGEPLNQGEVNETVKQLECLKKENRFSDVEGAIIICNSQQPHLKISTNIKIWDSTYMHLLGEKMKISEMIIASRMSYGDLQAKLKGYTFIWQISSVVDPISKEQKPNYNIYIFNEDPNKSIGKTDIFPLVDSLAKNPKTPKNVTSFIYIFSVSGIRTDLVVLKGKYILNNPLYLVTKIVDLSTATWTTYLDENFL